MKYERDFEYAWTQECAPPISEYVVPKGEIYTGSQREEEPIKRKESGRSRLLRQFFIIGAAAVSSISLLRYQPEPKVDLSELVPICREIQEELQELQELQDDLIFEDLENMQNEVWQNTQFKIHLDELDEYVEKHKDILFNKTQQSTFGFDGENCFLLPTQDRFVGMVCIPWCDYDEDHVVDSTKKWFEFYVGDFTNKSLNGTYVYYQTRNYGYVEGNRGMWAFCCHEWKNNKLINQDLNIQCYLGSLPKAGKNDLREDWFTYDAQGNKIWLNWREDITDCVWGKWIK